MDIIQVITQELKVEKWQVEAAVKLIDEGNTIPFISRYRKEATGSLNDEQLRTLFERLTYLRNLEDKKNQVLKSIEDQGKLTEELKKQILDAQTLVVVEDLYRPYRPKRRTRATIAKEKGLEPLADIILCCGRNTSVLCCQVTDVDTIVCFIGNTLYNNIFSSVQCFFNILNAFFFRNVCFGFLFYRLVCHLQKNDICQWFQPFLFGNCRTGTAFRAIWSV